MFKNYTLVSGATFRQRIPRDKLVEFTAINNNGQFWVGNGNRITRMQVQATDDYIELLITNTSSFTKGDYEYKVLATNDFGDSVVLVYGSIRVHG